MRDTKTVEGDEQGNYEEWFTMTVCNVDGILLNVCNIMDI